MDLPIRRQGVYDLDDGYLYRRNKKYEGKWYMRCAVAYDHNCKASYVVDCDEYGEPSNIFKIVTAHNHEPDETVVQAGRFLQELERAVQVMPGTTRNIFMKVIEPYPAEIKQIYTYNNLVGRMHHWLKKYNVQRRNFEHSYVKT